MFVPLKDERTWPALVDETGLAKLWRTKRPRTKAEFVQAMKKDLEAAVVGVDWNFSQSIRDNVMETLSGVKGENSIKIIGPNLDELEKLADQAADELKRVPGIQSVGIFSIMGQTNLEFAIDRDKCARWNVSVADVQDALATAVGGQAFTQMVEGEKTFDITLRWPGHLRSDEESILDIPVDVLKNRVAEESSETGVPSLTGSVLPLPAATGSVDVSMPTAVPRRRLRDLVTPLNEQGQRDASAPFTQRRLDDLPRAGAAADCGQVQRAGARPGQRGCGSPAEDGSPVQVALSRGMVGRV